VTVTVGAPTIALRPADEADEPLLRGIYASTREEELALVPWPDEERRAFLTQQFDLQSTHYRTHYADGRFDVVEMEGEPVGRLYVARWNEEIRVVDISLLPRFRGRGIGTELLRELLDEGARTGRRVTIHVEKHNPALRLYSRLGFVPAADLGLYLLMEASP
jgi:ribosomal protein S18 acetylase RimI-like enzyme